MEEEISDVVVGEGQITQRKSRTLLVEILLFYPKILVNPFVLGKISYAICKSELPFGGGGGGGLRGIQGDGAFAWT